MASDGPLISICAPYWRRQRLLDEMAANYAATYPDLDLEFSICDDGSPSPARVPDGWRVCHLPRKAYPLNPCVPINVAVDTATADIIVLTNPEIRHEEPVLHEMLGLLRNPDDYVTARCRHESKDGTNGLWLAGPDTDYSTGGRLPVPPGGHFHFLAMFHHSLWAKADGFDEDYRHGTACDDNDWLWRLYAAGARFKTTQGMVWHRRDEPVKWNMPHNRDLFNEKWPLEKRRRLVQSREVVCPT